jgi:hypothetical protein
MEAKRPVFMPLSVNIFTSPPAHAVFWRQAKFFECDGEGLGGAGLGRHAPMLEVPAAGRYHFF